MTSTNIERLRFARWATPSTAWAGADLERTVAAVCAAAGLHGRTLPPTTVYRGAVFPVVTWDLNALASRLRSGHPPILERAALRGLTEDRDPAFCPVTIQGFVSLAPLRAARVDLAVLSIHARGVWVTPVPPGADAWDAMECNVRGYTVVQAWDEEAEVVTTGHVGPDPSRHPLIVQDWLYREQLFDVALRAGLVPPL